jgi:hypothetical protein
MRDGVVLPGTALDVGIVFVEAASLFVGDESLAVVEPLPGVVSGAAVALLVGEVFGDGASGVALGDVVGGEDGNALLLPAEGAVGKLAAGCVALGL